MTQLEAGRTLQVAQGDTVVVCLAENPSTGYRWYFDATGALTPVGDEYASGAAALPGAAGERRLRFNAWAAGRHALSGALRRGWETGVAPQAAFSVVIEVR